MLYRKLRIGDTNLRVEADEGLVNLYIEDIVRLDALVSLLVYVDGTLPLIRCQKSFSKMMEEIKGLQYLYRERRLLTSSFNKYFNWNIGASIEVDLDSYAQEYQKGTSDIYMNAVHVGEKAVSNHLSLLKEEKVIIGILAYFTETLALLAEEMKGASIHQAGYNTRSLLANLRFIAYLDCSEERLKNSNFYTLLKDASLKFKVLHIEELTIKRLSDNERDITQGLAFKLREDYGKNLDSIFDDLNRLLLMKKEIMDYVELVLLNNNSVNPTLVRESIHARNLLHSLS